jgi:hypothetical protein
LHNKDLDSAWDLSEGLSFRKKKDNKKWHIDAKGKKSVTLQQARRFI